MSAGIKHWRQQRITSILLIPLTVWFLIFMSINIGKDYVDVKSSLEQPFNIVMMSLFLIATFLHLHQGLQVIIEDYFYKKTFLVLNNVFCGFLLIVGLFSLCKLAFFG
tara:strand:+ start:671 stop:994 length:324 start_codon:yes stop_codon:yes gene_type:complete